MLSYLKIIRPLNGIMSALAVYIATLIAGATLYPSMQVIYGMIVVFLVSCGGMVINDRFDVVADRLNKPHRPLPSGKIRTKIAVLYSVILFAAGIFLSYFINTYCFYIAIAASLLLVLYSWKLKKIIMVGHLSISLLVALTFIFGGLILNIFGLKILLLALLAFISNIGREIFKTVEDVMGDKHSEVTTIPIKYGVLKAKMIASVFIMAAVILSFLPFFLAIFGVVYLFFIVITDIMFIIAIVVPKNLNATVCKFAMLFALLSFLAGAVA